MRALPDDMQTSMDEQLTGLVCPDCAGAISIGVLGGGQSFLRFACRIGHSYSTVELLAAKEQRLEERMWSVIHAYEELATLLDELDGEQCAAIFTGTGGVDLRTRARSAAETARELRRIVAADRPLPVSPASAPVGDEPPGGGPP